MLSKVVGLSIKKSYTTCFMAQDAYFLAQDFPSMFLSIKAQITVVCEFFSFSGICFEDLS